MSVLNIKILVFSLIVIGGAFFFFRSDTAYLKKTTIKLIKTVSPMTTPLPQMTLLRKVQSVAKHIHFSVQYEIEWNNRVYQDRSLSKFRAVLTSYFKQIKEGKPNTPNKKDLQVTIKEGEPKSAEVQFPLKVFWREKQANCQVVLHWIKEKKWFINKIKVFSCAT